MRAPAEGPRSGGRVAKDDLGRFQNLSGRLAWRAETVRAADLGHPVMTHVALSGFTGRLATHTLDEYALTEPVDVFGTWSTCPTRHRPRRGRREAVLSRRATAARVSASGSASSGRHC
jgi:hypothetical protein